MTRILTTLTLGLLVSSAIGQTKTTPTLTQTLEWLSGTSGQESGDDNDRITFESNGGCSVTIVETRVKAGPGFWVKNTFSLSDIDTADIRIHPFPEQTPNFDGKHKHFPQPHTYRGL
jgi:hypothetical protein